MTGSLLVGAAPVIDPVEVLLPTSLGAIGQAALAVGTVASVLLVVLLGTFPPHRSTTTATDQLPARWWWWLLGVTAAAAITALALELSLRPGRFVLGDLAARQPAALAARLVVLAALGLLAGARTRSRLPWLLGAVLVMTTVPLAATGLAGPVAIVTTTAVALLAVAAVRLTLLRPAASSRAPASRIPRPIALLLSLTLLATSAATIVVPGWPDPVPPFHAERVVVSDPTSDEVVALDLTVAPVAPGRNEFHLYAWQTPGHVTDRSEGETDRGEGETDLAAVEVDLAAVELELHHAGEQTTFELLRVSPNHHLSYLLDLPAPGPWELTIVATRTGGGSLVARLYLEELP